MKVTTILCIALMFGVLVMDIFMHNISNALTAFSAMCAWALVGLYEIRIKEMTNDR